MNKKIILILATIFASCLQMTITSCSFAQEENAAISPTSTETEKEIITIQTPDGEEYTFHIELALTKAEQSVGLMYRTFMADDAGMLFIFDDEAMRNFWMKDTYIPLDMLFISKDGTIHHIHSHAKPQDTTRITSKKPSFAVLELNGGTTDKLGIKVGDKLLHPAFHNILP